MRNLRILRNLAMLGAFTSLCTTACGQVTYYRPGYAPAYAPYAYPVYSAPPVAAAVLPRYSDVQLDGLTGPIALYPDPLIAQILPAATFPLEIVSAAQWLRVNPQPSEEAINAQSWDPSVKALVHYPTVLQMMADRMDWTQSLGAAFQAQPADVMGSIQRMRSAAQAAGTLQNTPQQNVVIDQGAIRILPVEPSVVYVPIYDPALVYVRRPHYAAPAIGFSVGFGIGHWLNMDLDWQHRYIVSGRRWDHGFDEHDRRFERREPVIVREPIREQRHDEPRGGRRDEHHEGPPVVIPPHVVAPPAFHPMPEPVRSPQPPFHPMPEPVHPPVIHPAPVVVSPPSRWVRDPVKPMIVTPPPVIRPEQRGWVAPPARVEEHPQEHGFGGYQRGEQMERERDRGYQSMRH